MKVFEMDLNWKCILEEFKEGCIETKPKLWKTLLLISIICKRKNKDIITVDEVYAEWNKKCNKWGLDEVVHMAMLNLMKEIQSSGILEQVNIGIFKLMPNPDEIIDFEIENQVVTKE